MSNETIVIELKSWEELDKLADTIITMLGGVK